MKLGSRIGLLSRLALTGALALAVTACIDVGDEELFQVAGLSAVPSGPLNFQEHILPIFENNGCKVCHRAGGGRGSFDVTSVAGIHRGGDNPAGIEALVSCEPEQSLLYLQIADGTMPPGSRRLSDAEVDTVAKWIRQGGLETFTENVCENPPLD